ERRQGGLRAAIGDFGEYIQRADLLAAYARLQLAELYAAVGAPERADAEAERALALPGSRRLRIEALERLPETPAAGRGETRPPPAAHPHRAEVLGQPASRGRRTGDLTRAAERYQMLVVDYPSTRRAADALRALNDLDLADPISYFQAGLVRFHQGEY